MPLSLQEELVAAGLKHAWVHQAARYGRTASDDLVLVTGSIYVVGEIRAAARAIGANRR